MSTYSFPVERLLFVSDQGELRGVTNATKVAIVIQDYLQCE